RRDLMDLVQRDADIPHDVDHDRDHHIGVERTQQHCEAARADRDRAVVAARRPDGGGGGAPHHTSGLTTVTGLFHSDSVMVTVVPESGSSWAWTRSRAPSARIHAPAGTGASAPICGAIALTASGVTVPVTCSVRTPLMVSRPSTVASSEKLASRLARPVSGFRIAETS